MNSFAAKANRTMMDREVAITKALADSTRLRILHACLGGELCVCQINELFPVASSTISRHLSVLRNAGLLVSRKCGKWIHYRHPGNDASPKVRKSLDFAISLVAGTRQGKEDTVRLKSIRRSLPDHACGKSPAVKSRSGR